MKLFKKTSYISVGNFPSSKNEKKKNIVKKCLLFWEIGHSSLKIKMSYIFSKKIFFIC